METINISGMEMRKVNEILRGYGSTHRNVEIINPDARHYIGVGLINPIRVMIRGSAGYYCGGLTDGPHIEVEKNVSWAVGDNMFAGSVIVGGNVPQRDIEKLKALGVAGVFPTATPFEDIVGFIREKVGGGP